MLLVVSMVVLARRRQPGARRAVEPRRATVPHVVSDGAGLELRRARSGSVRSISTCALAVAPGELVVLVGPNGAGKTTLLRALAGLLPIDDGRIALDGEVLDDPASRSVRRQPPTRSIGVVFQDLLLFDHMTVADNVAFGLRSRGTLAARGAPRSHEAGWSASVSGVRRRARPAPLSGGQAQRVALARRARVRTAAWCCSTSRSPRSTRRRAATCGARCGAPRDARRAEVPRDPRPGRGDHARGPDRRARGRPRRAAGRARRRSARGRARATSPTFWASTSSGASSTTARSRCRRGTRSPSRPPPRSGRRVRDAAPARDHAAPGRAGRQRPQRVADRCVDLDDEGERVRVRVGDPLPLAVEITPPATRRLSGARHAGVDLVQGDRSVGAARLIPASPTCWNVERGRQRTAARALRAGPAPCQGGGRRSRRRAPAANRRPTAPTRLRGSCGTPHTCRTITSPSCSSAEQLWVSGSLGAALRPRSRCRQHRLWPPPEEVAAIRPDRPGDAARLPRRHESAGHRFLETLDAARPRPHRRPPLGSAGDARRAARERRRRQPSARRPGRVRARPACASEAGRPRARARPADEFGRQYGASRARAGRCRK